MEAHPQLAEHKHTPQTQIEADEVIFARQRCPEALWEGAREEGKGGVRMRAFVSAGFGVFQGVRDSLS